MDNASIVSTAIFSVSVVLGVIGFLLRNMLQQINKSIEKVDAKYKDEIDKLKSSIKDEIKKREDSYQKLEKKLNTFVTASDFKNAVAVINKSLSGIQKSVNKLNMHLPENYVSKESFQTEKDRITERIDRNQEKISNTNSKLSAVNERTGLRKIPTK